MNQGENYKSAKDALTQVKAQVEEEMAKGFIIEVPQLQVQEVLGDLPVISALVGAVPKDLEGGKVRDLFDATHSSGINRHIRVQSRLRYPLVGDLAWAIEQLAPIAKSR
eukprot:6468133-Amphidinium_carterae.1